MLHCLLSVLGLCVGYTAIKSANSIIFLVQFCLFKYREIPNTSLNMQYNITEVKKLIPPNITHYTTALLTYKNITSLIIVKQQHFLHTLKHKEAIKVHWLIP